MKASLGRIVHFVDGELTHHAAIITKVFSDTCVNLTVFHAATGVEYRTSVLQAEKPGAGWSWHWPERE